MSHISPSPGPAYRTIIRLPTFERTAAGLITDEQHRWLDTTLAGAPDSGAVIPGTGGVRKLRTPAAGRGKRGGARVIYYYRGATERVYLILAYAKGVKEDLSGGERREIRRLVAKLEAEP